MLDLSEVSDLGDFVVFNYGFPVDNLGFTIYCGVGIIHNLGAFGFLDRCLEG